MGMYTELIFSAALKVDIPEIVIKVLQYMVNRDIMIVNRPKNLPDHDFFNCEYWDWILFGASYYFPDTIDPIFRFDDIGKDWRLTTRSNIKNYDNEIEKFLNWIKPYISQGSGAREYYAIVCYEEQSEPTIYYLE
jgi:hypothetical protein